jgi:hypothetical protein
MTRKLFALLICTIAFPFVALERGHAEMKPGTQIWSRIEGNVEHRLTIEAISVAQNCCMLEGHMQIFVDGKLTKDLHLAQRNPATWWDEGTPVSIEIISDEAGKPSVDLNTMLLDKDTLVLYNGWFPNRNTIYKRLK